MTPAEKRTATLKLEIPNRTLASTLLEQWSGRSGVSLNILRGRLTPDAAAYEEHHAGAMHLFGVVRASTRSAGSAGNGLTFSIDITGIVEALKEKNAWDEKNVRVTFLPREGAEAHGAPAEHDPISIGRISIYQS